LYFKVLVVTLFENYYYILISKLLYFYFIITNTNKLNREALLLYIKVLNNNLEDIFNIQKDIIKSNLKQQVKSNSGFSLTLNA
jgi:predicted nucleic-acid-binding protein